LFLSRRLNQELSEETDLWKA